MKLGGKSSDTMEKATMVASDQTTTTKTLPTPTPSTTNVLLWLLCLASLAFSVYTSLGQTYFENRIRHLRQLDDRVSMLEAQIKSLPAVWLDRIVDTPLKDPEEMESVADVMRRLSEQVSGISRLRRDVSQLKSRRNERQTNGDISNGCMCPAGK